jgi:DNA-binding GntR family transcriptional regulator
MKLSDTAARTASSTSRPKRVRFSRLPPYASVRVLTRGSIADRRVVDLLDHDEALLTILYTASGNPVLVNMIKTLWQHCRAYKTVGARGTLDAERDDSLWRYQKDLVAAARNHDGAAALSVSDASLDNATQRIRALLAAEKDEETISAL